MDLWKSTLYPLGFLAQICFGMRFFVQWYESERAKKQITPPVFWKLSIAGNSILFIHSLIQSYYPLCLLLSVNMVLFWRNLQLQKPIQNECSLKRIVCYLFAAASASTLLFAIQNKLPSSSWLSAPWSSNSQVPVEVSSLVHLLGIIGILFYSLRFWLQWWHAEKHKKSEFPKIFWHLSLVGATVSIFYFSFMRDWVNLSGAICSLIPYSRNLLLLKREKKPEQEPEQKPEQDRSLFLFAGEVSADLYGGQIAAHLKKALPDVSLWGVGGPSMRKMEFSCLLPMEAFRVMGFYDVLKSLPKLLFYFFKLKRAILKRRPESVLFIDAPAFAMKLAASLRKSGFSGKIIQFVAPSVWAWKKERAQKMAKDFDLLLTLFDFEPKYFTGLKTTYVGHPIFDIIEEMPSYPRDALGLDLARPILAIFPGSRPQEIKNNLKKQLEAATLFSQKFPEVQIAVCTEERLSSNVTSVPFSMRYQLMKHAHLALAKSGTVTLELALLGVPTIVTYELSLLNKLMTTYVYKVDLPFYCIVNILSQKPLFCELIRPPVKIQDIEEQLTRWFTNKELRDRCQEECRLLHKKLKTEIPPTERVAKEICELLKTA
jgi:lipid-A-disaccharide synthase